MSEPFTFWLLYAQVYAGFILEAGWTVPSIALKHHPMLIQATAFALHAAFAVDSKYSSRARLVCAVTLVPTPFWKAEP